MRTHTPAGLFVVGCAWCCTRPYAALVLIILGLAGDLALLGGTIATVAWAICTVAGAYPPCPSFPRPPDLLYLNTCCFDYLL